nr:MAG TPA: tail tape measure protein [Caudoviricetes sp.]
MASNNTTSQLTIRINGKEVENTFTALNREVRTLSRELRNLTPGTEEFQQRAAQLREAQAHFNRVRDEINQVNGAITQTATSTSRFGDIVRGVFTGNLITGFFSSFVGKARESVDELLKVSDLMTGVEKTTGLASEEVRQLWNEFDELNTRTSKQELLNIAQIGGRLGINDKEQIKEFTEEIDKIYVALGDSFQGGLEEVTTKVGKLKNLFEETRNQNYGEALNAIGSALNELGANGSSSEQNITEFATRIGALPAVLKPSIEKTLGLGAAFEESGIDAEVASSGYSRFMSVAGNNIAAFAKQMKLTTKEASELFNTHPEEFFLRFGESLKGLGAEQTAGVLKGLKLNTLEVQKALGTAGDNADRFRQLMNLSGQAMQDGTSIQNEFNKVNENTAAIWEKIKKVFAETFTSDTMAQWFGGLIKLLGWLTGVTSKAGDGVKVFRERIAFLAKAIVVCTTAIVSYRAAVFITANITKVGTAQTLLYNAATKITTTLNGMATKTTYLLAAAKAVLTGNFKSAAAAMRAFNAVAAANPLGALLAVIGAIVAAMTLFNKKVDENVRLQKRLQEAQREVKEAIESEKNKIQTLVAIIKDETKSRNERLTAMKQLQDIAPDYFKTLDLDKIKTEEGTKAIDAYINALRRKKEAEKKQQIDSELGDEIEEIKKNGPLAYNSKWNIANLYRDEKNYEPTYKEYLDKKRKQMNNLIKAGKFQTQAQVDEYWKKVVEEAGWVYENQNQLLREKEAARAKNLQEWKKLEADNIAERARLNALNGGTGGNDDPPKPTKEPKDYADEYRNANKARLAAEQELQKEITQGLEESLDKQLALTEQKYNDKRFKLQQENADLEQDILKLKTEAKGNNDPKLLKTIQEKRKLQELNKQIAVEYEKQEQAELTQVREKHAAKEVERTLKEMNDCLAVKKREKAEELLQIQDLDTAKEALRGQISDKELSKIKTLEEAKKALRRKADEEIIKESIANLEAQEKLLMGYLQTVTGEAKDKLIEDIQKGREQMTKLKEELDALKTKGVDKDAGTELEKVDLLGYTAKDWEDVFKNLNTMQGRFKAVEMGIGTMNNAFSMFSQLQENLNARELSKYTANQQKKKQALLDQLNQGYISQAQYQKEVQRLDEEAETKKKELAIKQFKAQKAANMLNIIANTALAVTRAYVDGGAIGGIALAAIVAAIGAAQLGIVAAQQPPSYAKGGYTKGLGFTDETGHEVAGVVHGKEYVIPAMLLADPQVARVTEWIEAKRTGKSQNTYATGGNISAVPDEPSTLAKSESLSKSETSMSELKNTLTQLTATLDRLEKNGLDAYVIADAKNGREMQRAIKEYENIREKNRR